MKIYYSLVGLQNFEEVFALEHSILWHICAVDSVLNFVLSELGSEGATTEMLSYFWIVWTHEFSE